MSSTWLGLLCAVLHAQAPTGSPPPVTTLFLMPLEAKNGVSADLADQATTLIAVEVSRQPGVRVITGKDAEALLTIEARSQLMECNTQSCAAQIAGALNSDEVLLGSLGRIGNEHLLTLTRLRVKDSSVLSRGAERSPVDDPSSLFAMITRAVNGAFLPPSQATPVGPPAVVTTPPVVPDAPVAASPPDAQPSEQRPPQPVTLAEARWLGVPALAWVLGTLAVGSAVPTVVGVVVMVLLTATSPAWMLAAVYAGFARSGVSSSDPSSSEFLTGLGLAFVVFPAAWAAVGVATLAVFLLGQVLGPVALRLAFRVLGAPVPGTWRWVTASLIGVAAGGIGFVPSAAAVLGGGALLLGMTALLLPAAEPYRPGRVDFMETYGLGMLLGGLFLCAVSMIPAAGGVLVSTWGALAAALPLFSSAPVE